MQQEEKNKEEVNKTLYICTSDNCNHQKQVNEQNFNLHDDHADYLVPFDIFHQQSKTEINQQTITLFKEHNIWLLQLEDILTNLKKSFDKSYQSILALKNKVMNESESLVRLVNGEQDHDNISLFYLYLNEGIIQKVVNYNNQINDHLSDILQSNVNAQNIINNSKPLFDHQKQQEVPQKQDSPQNSENYQNNSQIYDTPTDDKQKQDNLNFENIFYGFKQIKFLGRIQGNSKENIVNKAIQINEDNYVLRCKNSLRDENGSLQIKKKNQNFSQKDIIQGVFQVPRVIDEKIIITPNPEKKEILLFEKNDNEEWIVTKIFKISDRLINFMRSSYHQGIYATCGQYDDLSGSVIYRIINNKWLDTIEINNKVYPLDICSDFIAFGDNKGYIYKWFINSNECKRKKILDTIMKQLVIINKELILTGDFGGNIKLWKNEYKCLKSLKLFNTQVMQILLISDSYFAVGSFNGTICFIQILDDNCIEIVHQFQPFQGSILSLEKYIKDKELNLLVCSNIQECRMYKIPIQFK